MAGSEIEFYWNKAFGQAVLDWIVEPGGNSIAIEVDWNAASWGLGAEILLKEPINLKEVAEIEVTAYTGQGSSTKIYAMVATPDDANLSFPSLLAYPVKLDPSKFTFPIKKMVRDMPETTSKNFNEGDWKRVDRIKFILTKPAKYDQENDVIFISSVRIIYHGGINAKIRREDLDLDSDKVVKSSETIENPDLENRIRQDNQRNVYEVDKQQTDEIVVNETVVNEVLVDEAVIDEIPEQQEKTVEKREITHFQSLDELMDQYPSDDPDDPEAANNISNNTNQKLTFDQIKIYENCVQDWKTLDNENKFFFDVNWKNYKSRFTMDFLTEDPIEISGKLYITFKAQTLDRSKPQVRVTSYYGNESVFSKGSVTLKNKLKTFYIPLVEKDLYSSNADELARKINRIKVTCFNTDSGSIEEDVIVIKDFGLVKKRKN